MITSAVKQCVKKYLLIDFNGMKHQNLQKLYQKLKKY